jgi:hypothetical protein
MSQLIFSIIAITVVVLAQGSRPRVSYPEERREALSADGRFAVSNVDSDGSAPNHELVLIDKKTDQRSKIIAYMRHVKVEWAPSGHAFSITNYEGSDASVCLIGIVSDKVEITDVSQLLVTSSKGRLSRKEAGDHLYCEVTKWLNNSEAVLHVHGYGNKSLAKLNQNYTYNIRTRTVSSANKSSKLPTPH